MYLVLSPLRRALHIARACYSSFLSGDVKWASDVTVGDLRPLLGERSVSSEKRSCEMAKDGYSKWCIFRTLYVERAPAHFASPRVSNPKSRQYRKQQIYRMQFFPCRASAPMASCLSVLAETWRSVIYHATHACAVLYFIYSADSVWENTLLTKGVTHNFKSPVTEGSLVAHTQQSTSPCLSILSTSSLLSLSPDYRCRLHRPNS